MQEEETIRRPPGADIAFPKNGGYPTHHNIATEGAGSYADPITFATDQKEFAPGTIVYVPYLQKYFIMEDECVACDGDWKNGKYHIDLWMGPNNKVQPQPALENCEDFITRNAPVTTQPANNLPVDQTPLFDGSKCTAKIH